MLSFARQAPLTPTNVDLNQLIRNMHKWILPTLPSIIDVRTSLHAGLLPIMVDVSSAENGLLNLILNARDVMADGGKLTIETTNIEIGEEHYDFRGEKITPGHYVMLAVSDTGEGIPPSNMVKIFEPFFTTKAVGSGSGLGLSMLEGFMKQSGGATSVYSEQGIGTTFKLYFPASTDAPDQSNLEETPKELNRMDKKSTILLVEDNAEVLKAIRTTLLKSGYRVLSAASGDAAMKIFNDEPVIDLLLTDIVMPGKMQGTTLARALRDLRPNLPVIFMSGYAREATVHGNGLHPEDIRLMKPVRREELLSAISKALLSGDGSVI
jgi:CheY-like chemotaxis protein